MKTIRKVITVLFIIATTGLFAQKVSVSKQFFSSKNTKVALSVGAEFSGAGDTGKSGMIKAVGSNITNDNIFHGGETAINLGLDVYSANSVLGFYSEINYNMQNYSIRNPNHTAHDSLKVSNLEIPLYLKFRIGNGITSHNHLWLAVGAGYSIVNKVENVTYNDITMTPINKIEDKSLFSNVLYGAAILGYEMIIPLKEANGKEFFDRDGFRVLFYFKANKDFGNRINTDYNNFVGTTVLGTFDSGNPELKFTRMSFGLKLLMRISQAAKTVNEVIKKSQKNYY